MTPAPDRSALSFIFNSFPFKKRAKMILAYYAKRPGLWEKMHPESGRSKR